MGGGFNPLSIVSDAMNALKDIGQTLEDVGSGNFGKLGQDLGKDFGDITKLGTDVASVTNPELAPFLQMAQPLLGGLAQQAFGGAGGAGGFNPLQLLGNPNPFTAGGAFSNPGIQNNPYGYAPSFPSGGSGPSGGLQQQLADVNSWPSKAAQAAGGSSWSDLQNQMQNATDPAQIAQIQAKMNMYLQMCTMLSQGEKAAHDAATQIARNISA